MWSLSCHLDTVRRLNKLARDVSMQLDAAMLRHYRDVCRGGRHPLPRSDVRCRTSRQATRPSDAASVTTTSTTHRLYNDKDTVFTASLHCAWPRDRDTMKHNGYETQNDGRYLHVSCWSLSVSDSLDSCVSSSLSSTHDRHHPHVNLTRLLSLSENSLRMIIAAILTGWLPFLSPANSVTTLKRSRQYL